MDITNYELDLDYGNVESEVLTHNKKDRIDEYQQEVKYTNWKKEKMSSADGGKFKSWLDTLTTTTDTVKTYGATKEGYNIGENRSKYDRPKTEVRILGMKPLVFTLVSLGVVIATGIAIARIGKKAVK